MTIVQNITLFISLNFIEWHRQISFTINYKIKYSYLKKMENILILRNLFYLFFIFYFVLIIKLNIFI